MIFNESDTEDKNIEKIIDESKLYFSKLHLKKDNNIFYDGNSGINFYLIKNGFASLDYSLSNGQHHIVQFNGPGDIIGLEGWSRGRHYLNAKALTDIDLCCLRVTDLHQAMLKNYDLFTRMEDLRTKFFLSNQEHNFSLSNHSALQKLAFFLFNWRMRFNPKSDSGDLLKLPMSRMDITNHLGITTETLSRSFGYLENKKLIHVNNRYIRFLNIKDLTRMFL